MKKSKLPLVLVNHWRKKKLDIYIPVIKHKVLPFEEPSTRKLFKVSLYATIELFQETNNSQTSSVTCCVSKPFANLKCILKPCAFRSDICRCHFTPDSTSAVPDFIAQHSRASLMNKKRIYVYVHWTINSYMRTFLPFSFSAFWSIQVGKSLYCLISGSRVSTFSDSNFPIRVSYRFLASSKTSSSDSSGCSSEFESKHNQMRLTNHNKAAERSYWHSPGQNETQQQRDAFQRLKCLVISREGKY